MRKEDVVGLEVEVQDLVLMEVLDSLEQLTKEEVKTVAPMKIGWLIVEDPRKRVAIDIFHEDALCIQGDISDEMRVL